MKNIQLRPLVRDSILITIAVGVLAGVLATWISNGLFSAHPHWEYVVFVILIFVLLLAGRLLVALYTSIRSLSAEMQQSRTNVAITKTAPSGRVALGDVLLKARNEIVFFGISAKRSVTDDTFRRALERIENRQLRLRFLILDPSCSAFEERAQEQGEPSDTWRADQQTTTSRLSAYKRLMNLNIELRYFSSYPIWRAIIIDREQVFVSTFLPGKRGTEACQYSLNAANEELAYGLVKFYHTTWKQAREVQL